MDELVVLELLIGGEEKLLESVEVLTSGQWDGLVE